MHRRSIDTIAKQWSKNGGVNLTQDETRHYLPNLDENVRQHTHKPHESAHFLVEQGGYEIRARATYLDKDYNVVIYWMNRIVIPKTH